MVWEEKATTEEIETARMRIRVLTDAQLREVVDAERDPELKEAYAEMLDGALANPERRLWHTLWVMTLKDERETVVGNLDFKGLDASRVVEIGYATTPGYEGRGLMTEAVGAMIRWAVATGLVDAAEAETAPENAASQRVLEKNGFRFAGKFGEEGPRFRWDNPR